MKTKLALFALLTVIVGGCQKQNKTGEAFVVLKSGEVIYMADMEVICLKPNFKGDFNRWTNEYNSESKSLTREIESTKGKRIKELEDDAAKISQEQKAITTETIQIINAYIKDAGLAVPNLKFEDLKDSDYNLFKLSGEWARKEERPSYSSWHQKKLEGGFLLDKVDDNKDTNHCWWEFCMHIPREMEGTTVETTIKTASQKWGSLELRKLSFRTAAWIAKDGKDPKLSELDSKYRQEFYELVKKDTIATVRTGSKGDFIAPSGAAYLYAETQRDNGEKLAWLVHLDPKSPEIKMSVSNAAAAGGDAGFDNFWMLQFTLTD